MPKEAPWSNLNANAKQPHIGKFVDEPLVAIERGNPSFKGVLPKEHTHPRLDKPRLGQLIDLIGNIRLGDEENRSKDILGRAFEYFLSQFASAERKKGGQFYTPHQWAPLTENVLSWYNHNELVEQLPKLKVVPEPGRYINRPLATQ